MEALERNRNKSVTAYSDNANEGRKILKAIGLPIVCLFFIHAFFRDSISDTNLSLIL